jgi:pimeloyl-ACP methyl ester carboxylesterase
MALPSFLPPEAARVSEPAALRVLGNLRRCAITVETPELRAEVQTSFWQNEDAVDDAPSILFLHGADSSVLEWRYLVEKLGSSYACTALDWWSGGFTERGPITRRLVAGGSADPAPWTLVRQHIYAFWRQQLHSKPMVLVGASLGGAVALDFAQAHPGAVSSLVLVDAGGESYKAPPPEIVRALAPAVLGVKSLAAWVQRQLPSEDSLLASLHRTQPDWIDSYAAYLASGGYVCRVGPELIRTIEQPTLVIWGADDPILPLSDAFDFRDDLPACAGIRQGAGAGHSPHLDDPAAVAGHIARFVEDPNRAQRIVGRLLERVRSRRARTREGELYE